VNAEATRMGKPGQDRVRDLANAELQRASVGDQACGVFGNVKPRRALLKAAPAEDAWREHVDES
jgi:hypothetical protein